MGIERVILEADVCDGCGCDEFHVDYGFGVVLPDGRVYCDRCASPDDLEEEHGPGYYGEAEYTNAWERWRSWTERRPLPEPLGWAHWQRLAAEQARLSRHPDGCECHVCRDFVWDSGEKEGKSDDV